MAKVPLSDVNSRYGSVGALNANFDAIQEAFDNMLSRDGTAPNFMEAPLDMNGQAILNVSTVNAGSIVLGGVTIEPENAVAVATVQVFEFTATAGQTSFSVSPLTPTSAGLIVEVNGVTLPVSAVSITGSTLLLPAMQLGDEVVVRVFTREIGAADPTTASNVSFVQSGAGTSTRTVEAKLRDVINVNDFAGVDPTGATSSSAGINAALASGARYVQAHGVYLLTTSLLLPDNVVFDCKGARFLAGTNSMTMLRNAGTSSYYSQVWGGIWEGNGRTNVTAMDFENMRINAGVYAPRWKDLNIGLISRNGMFGAVIENPGSERVPFPVRVLANASTLVIRNPSFDNSPSFGGDGTGIGIDIRFGAGDNIGVRVEGGYVQGFESGVKDAGIATVVENVYIELCTFADIEGATARASNYKTNTHYGPSGPNGYRLRNCDGIIIDAPTMASGARTGLFDIDNTNTNCVARMAGSNAALNTPLGSVTGVLLTDYTVGFTATDASGASLSLVQNKQAYRSHHGLRVTIDVDITYPTTANTAFAAVALPVPARSGAAVSGVCGFTNYGQAVFIEGSGNAINFYSAAGGAFTNADLSGRRLVFSVSYVAQ